MQLDPNFALAWARLSRATRFFTFAGWRQPTAARRDAAKSALENAQKLEPNSPETLLALGYYQYRVLRDYEPRQNHVQVASAKCYQAVARYLRPSARVARREGHWDQSIAYFEQALALDPRNVELLMECGNDLRPCFDNSRPR